MEPTLATVAVPRAGLGRPRQKPQRAMADKAYASDLLRAGLARRGIELTSAHTAQGRVAPFRPNRDKLRTQERSTFDNRKAGNIMPSFKQFRQIVQIVRQPPCQPSPIARAYKQH